MKIRSLIDDYTNIGYVVMKINLAGSHRGFSIFFIRKLNLFCCFMGYPDDTDDKNSYY